MTVRSACFYLLLLTTAACHSSSTPTVDDQGVSIAYTDAGHGDTTLVFVHGWCLDKTYWSKQVDFFKNRYRVVAVDLPGFGESGKNRTDWSVAAFGRDIDSVLSQLKLKNVILVGHSMAGDIVVEAALHASDRVIAVVGVDNFKNIHPETQQQKDDDARMVVLLKQGFTQAAFQFFNDDLFYTSTPDSVRKRILTDVANADSVVATACMAQNSYDEAKNLAAWGRPLYLINSDYQATDTTAFRAASIPYKIFWIRDTGHFPMVENPDEFNAQLEKALSVIGGKSMI